MEDSEVRSKRWRCFSRKEGLGRFVVRCVCKLFKDSKQVFEQDFEDKTKLLREVNRTEKVIYVVKSYDLFQVGKVEVQG